MNIVLNFMKVKASEALKLFGKAYNNTICLDLRNISIHTDCCNMNSKTDVISIYCEGKSILKNSMNNLTIIITGDRSDGQAIKKLGKVIQQQFGIEPILLAS